jgi:hypothetical protein
MQCIIPRVRGTRGAAAPVVFRPLSDKDGILHLHKKGLRADDMLPLVNKQPKWNEALQAYCLNFNGRVTQVRGEGWAAGGGIGGTGEGLGGVERGRFPSTLSLIV